MQVPSAPGTVIPCDQQGGMFSIFRPMMLATGGLTLGQISAITGIEAGTLQNWIKRGFVAHPVQKKYQERQLARILLIASLRDSMRIEQIGDLFGMINGDVEDESDDIISESALYDYFCEVIRRMGENLLSDEHTDAIIAAVTADFDPPDASRKARLRRGLAVMACAYYAGQLRRQADAALTQMQTEYNFKE